MGQRRPGAVRSAPRPWQRRFGVVRGPLVHAQKNISSTLWWVSTGRSPTGIQGLYRFDGIESGVPCLEPGSAYGEAHASPGGGLGSAPHDEAQLLGPGEGLGATDDVELLVDVVQVGVNRARADAEGRPHLLVGEALADVPEDLAFAV